MDAAAITQRKLALWTAPDKVVDELHVPACPGALAIALT